MSVPICSQTLADYLFALVEQVGVSLQQDTQLDHLVQEDTGAIVTAGGDVPQHWRPWPLQDGHIAPDTVQIALSDVVFDDGLRVEGGQIWDGLKHKQLYPMKC
jgi:hypothetical protein